METQHAGNQRTRAVPRIISTLLVSFTLLASASAGKMVVLDPGHGGRDNGAKWGGVAEKDLNLDVAKRVEQSYQ